MRLQDWLMSPNNHFNHLLSIYGHWKGPLTIDYLLTKNRANNGPILKSSIEYPSSIEGPFSIIMRPPPFYDAHLIQFDKRNEFCFSFRGKITLCLVPPSSSPSSLESSSLAQGINREQQKSSSWLEDLLVSNLLYTCLLACLLACSLTRSLTHSLTHSLRT